MGLFQIGQKQKPSLKSSWLRKLTSRCGTYEADFDLFALLHDIALARQITGAVASADKLKISAGEAVSTMQNFDGFWEREGEKLQDMVRQQRIRQRRLDPTANGMPNLFFTVAPAEWKFPLHDGVLGEHKQDGALSDVQSLVTLHVYQCMAEIIKKVLLSKQLANHVVTGIDEVYDYSMRFEFQSRGTLHVHVVAWVK